MKRQYSWLPATTFRGLSSRLFFFLFFSGLLLMTSPLLASGQRQVIKIGVLAYRGVSRCFEEWKPLADYLTDHTDGNVLYWIEPLRYQDIEEEVQQQKIDFLITNPYNYVELCSKYKLKRLTTLVRKSPQGSSMVLGGVVFAKASRKDINHLQDLKNKRIAAVAPNSFGGWISILRELHVQGIDPKRDFADLKFCYSQDKVIFRVNSGQADVGFVRTGILEKMLAEGQVSSDEFKVIREYPKSIVKEMTILHSTRSYPEWSCIALGQVPDSLAIKMSVMLYQLPADSLAARAAGIAGWTVPLDYHSVNDCLKELRLGSYVDCGYFEIKDTFIKYWRWYLVNIGFVLLLMLLVWQLHCSRKKISEVHRKKIGQAYQEQKKVVVRLRELEKQQKEQLFFLEELLNVLPNPVFYKDLEGKFLGYNQAFARLAGIEGNELLGKGPEYFLGGQMIQLAAATDNQVLDNQGSQHYECLLTLTDGSQRYYAIMKDSFRYQDGSPGGVIGAFYDLTEIKQAENRLSLLAAVVEQADSIVVISDCQRKITYLNPAFERITGYLVAEAQGKNVHEVFSPDLEQDRSRQELSSCLSRGETWHGTLQSKKKDGTIFAEETVTFPIRDDHGQIIGYVAIKHDISAQKKLEQQLLKASKMESIGQLAGGVAHDFNNILTVINGYAQIVLMQLEKDSRLWHDVREIEKAGERAAGLTRQLLAFSRKQVIMPKAIKMNDEILEMEKMLRRLIGEDVELEISLAENLPLIYADPSQLQQILLNLVVNARDALKNQVRHTGKRIKISTTRKFLDDAYVTLHPGSDIGWYVQLQVEDNGSGMAKEVTDHIFEPFYTTKGVGKGTGMGLATVYGIVKQNQGSIYVYSEPGQGTSFKIYWPETDDDSLRQGPEPGKAPAGGSEVILLAEDNKSLREMSSRQLRQAGYTVIEAEHGLDALEKARNHQGPIDLLLTDVVMPVMDGKELSEKIKEIYPDIPVLFGSGYMDDSIHQDIINLGEDHFINKPYNISDILDRIRHLLDGRGSNLYR